MNPATRRISDAQIDLALRNIRAKINEDCGGHFDAHAVREVIEHSPAYGPALLHEMARASLPLLPATDAERIVKNRAKALFGYATLQDRVGQQRLFCHLSRQSSFYMELVDGSLVDNSRISR